MKTGANLVDVLASMAVGGLRARCRCGIPRAGIVCEGCGARFLGPPELGAPMACGRAAPMTGGSVRCEAEMGHRYHHTAQVDDGAGVWVMRWSAVSARAPVTQAIPVVTLPSAAEVDKLRAQLEQVEAELARVEEREFQRLKRIHARLADVDSAIHHGEGGLPS